MKILFFIRTKGKGLGGHYYSLDHISKELANKHEVSIISIGPNPSKAIEGNPLFLQHIYTSKSKLLRPLTDLRKLIKNASPDILHCFDLIAYNYIRFVANSNKIKIVLTICGGPNPSKMFHVKNLILFSSENLEWFNSYEIYKNSNIFLIPNRVKQIEIERQLIKKNTGEFTIMKIGRISNEYKAGLHIAVNLLNYLHNIKHYSNVKLYIIGNVEDTQLYKELLNNHLLKKGVLVLITEEKYTIEASQLLYLADAVIGTGRGLMEASSLGKPLLVYNANGDFPVLLTKDNFFEAFKTNFSQRNIFSCHKENKNLEAIERMIVDKNFYNILSRFSFEIFYDHFDISKVVERYDTVYLNSEFSRRHIISDFWKIVSQLKAYYSSF